jgi:8-oxo-dGTP pyrophosphatase MutT (NUDIX family)
MRTLIPKNIEAGFSKQGSAKQERVRVVLPYKGQYLLERLTNPNWPKNIGKMRHIGGGIESGETPQEAASREMYEELGAHINPDDFVSLGKHDGHHYLELKNHRLHPGQFNATVGSDPVITLEKQHPAGPKYMGPSLHQLYGNSR